MCELAKLAHGHIADGRFPQVKMHEVWQRAKNRAALVADASVRESQRGDVILPLQESLQFFITDLLFGTKKRNV